MLRILEAEIKKLYASKIWWLIAAGAVLPGLITYLSFLQNHNISWLIFLHVALLILNVQSLLTFSAFAAFLCAREYEDNTIEIILCYPYPKGNFLFAKLAIMFLIIGITVILFGICTLCFGAALLSSALTSTLLLHFIKILLLVILMHFLLSPAAFLIARLTRMAISGVIYGIIGTCLCMMLYKTNFIQFIPTCIPFDLTDHILGMDVMKIVPNYSIHWGILAGWFVLFLLINFNIRSSIYSRS
jgi:bacitracin transport system permease protein